MPWKLHFFLCVCCRSHRRSSLFPSLSAGTPSSSLLLSSLPPTFCSQIHLLILYLLELCFLFLNCLISFFWEFLFICWYILSFLKKKTCVFKHVQSCLLMHFVSAVFKNMSHVLNTSFPLLKSKFPQFLTWWAVSTGTWVTYVIRPWTTDSVVNSPTIAAGDGGDATSSHPGKDRDQSSSFCWYSGGRVVLITAKQELAVLSCFLWVLCEKWWSKLATVWWRWKFQLP